MTSNRGQQCDDASRAVPSAPREVELKLEMEPGTSEALLRHPLLRGAIGEPQANHSVYYDTDDKRLKRAGLSLRVRRTDGRIVQTVKSDSKASAGLFDRMEWEAPISGPGPEPDRLQSLDALLGGGEAGARLKPLFETRVERRSGILNWKGARIEVAVDEGVVIAGDRQQPVHEIELELKDGPASALFDLAHALHVSAPLRLGVLTKAERGARLASRRDGRASKAEPLVLSAEMSLAQAFEAIVFACLRHYRANEPLVVAARDFDALHQSRVALRRLRSAFSLFRPALAPVPAERFRDELRALSIRLGAARNLDVFLKRRGEELSSHARKAVAEERRSAYEVAIRQLKSLECQRLFLDLAGEAALGRLIAPEKQDRPLGKFAPRVLDRFWKKVKRLGHALGKLDDEERHELRIAGKKLRYAAEFFANLYAEDAVRRDAFLVELESLQDHLGDLNDFVTEVELRHQLHAQGVRLALKKHAVPHTEKHAALAAAEASYGRLAQIGPFWR